ncbi:putative glucan 1,4-alpha-glucosidase [Pseudovirgaria hyperparasitica]|uniref:Glucoamylase n=1 Tax=Pseudovirgaria hyperparasitica TaxID=470096 RepID=A0A6A6W4T5_9PEZI|nr:putative glucan 1,4-alpha-glucosidase [Pseudovirgaria hyperparasitica]KAF2757603.1 putative glucan 1,4-alpha-glucosidase [Pseudovirgaria hyperparasitica]
MIASIFLAALAAVHVTAWPRYGNSPSKLDSYIESQLQRSLQGVFDNIGPDGAKAPGAHAGIVIASPSTLDPDYYFTWTRDSALTLKMVVDEFLTGNENVEHYIKEYITAQAILQTVSNPSGSLSSGRGLGEPKYYSNITRFNRSWGRPQRDGPALRATAIIAYARYLLSRGKTQEVKSRVWPVVKNDLAYVAQFWNSTGFDLWEEVNGRSFFATAVQHRALVEGAALANKIGLSCADCDSQAPNVLCLLQTYWNGQYIVSNMGVSAVRTGIDANSVLGSLATFDPTASCTDETFQPCSHRALANLKVYVDSFRPAYTINAGLNESVAAATGRYTEDVYYFGNPWYLTTLAVAEQLYDAVQQWRALSSLTVTSVDLAFWKAIKSDAAEGTYNAGTQSFDSYLSTAMTFADGFVDIVKKYTPIDGGLAEQYSRENGTAVSARDLTWSYASFVTMAAARRAALIHSSKERKPLQVPSWGEPNANKVPSVCLASSAPGTYIPATSAGAPAGAGGCTLTVTFNVNASTFFGENVYIFGNTTDLGAWNTQDAIAGNAAGYTSDRPLWDFEIDLPASSGVEYAFLRAEPDGSFIREDVNRTYTIPPCGDVPGNGTATVEDAWSGPVGTPAA